MFGSGGVYAELFRDVSFRLIPVTPSQAKEMITATRAHDLLMGFRGKPGGDIDGLAAVIVRLSDLIHGYPDIVEVDLNPVIVYPRGAAVADARMVVRRP
jgi:acyl-CoA synthetase (NDP forming)